MGFLAALQFLTAIPLKRGFTAGQVARSSAWFPLVGLLIGAVLAGLSYLYLAFLPGTLADVLLIASLTVITGGLHIDGLVDTCDGMGGRRSAEERLRIMDDSRTGAFGVVGAVLLLLTQYAALVSVPSSRLAASLVLMALLSRWAMVYSVFAYPAARRSGLGRSIKEGMTWRQLAIATAVTLVATLALFRWAGLAVLVSVWLVVILAAGFLKWRLGGLTGDTYGAINELAEVSVLVALNLLFFKGWLV